VGYVPQKFQYNVNFPVTVMDVVLMGQLGQSRFYGPYSAVDRQAARRALCQADLEGFEDRSFDALSGGQVQRALIARALTSDPDMLMLDEPTASLDAPAEADIYSLLQQLNEHMTIIVVTHDFGFVSRVVKSVLCVNRTVNRHPTSDLDDVTGDLLRELYGSDLRVVRHDRHIGEDHCRE
jgi:zinc transport system ATP-binding protein